LSTPAGITVLILYSYCTHTVLILYSYCTHTVLILYSYYTHTVRILYSYCAHTVLILCSYCTHTVLILYSYCTHTVLILYSYCAHTALILYSYYTHTVRILYSYCTHYRYDDPGSWGNPIGGSRPFSAERLAAGEDPYLYKNADGNFHCLFHAFDRADTSISPVFFPGTVQHTHYRYTLYTLYTCTHARFGAGTHAFSRDGKVWYYSGMAYSNAVQFSDGTVEYMKRRERPHLVSGL
jgi:hypothetical protein